jgi:hypothetical protein
MLRKRKSIRNREAGQVRESESGTKLKLQNTVIADVGLTRLKAMPALRSVWTKGTDVTRDGINRLNEARPDITVFAW